MAVERILGAGVFGGLQTVVLVVVEHLLPTPRKIGWAATACAVGVLVSSCAALVRWRSPATDCGLTFVAAVGMVVAIAPTVSEPRLFLEAAASGWWWFSSGMCFVGAVLVLTAKETNNQTAGGQFQTG